MTDKPAPTTAEIEAYEAALAFNAKEMGHVKAIWASNQPNTRSKKDAETVVRTLETIDRALNIGLRALKAKAAGAKMLTSALPAGFEEKEHESYCTAQGFFEAAHKAAPCMLEDSNGL